MPDDVHGHVKGSTFLATLAFVEDRFGDAGKARYLAALSDADRELMTSLIMTMGWYPLDSLVRGLHVLEREFGTGDLSLLTERGRWTAVRDMTTLRRSILKLVTPTWIVTRASGLWSQFHNTGSWTVEEVGPKSSIAKLRNLGVVDVALCASIRGWIIGVASLTGSKATVRHIRCRARKGESCDYAVDWV